MDQFSTLVFRLGSLHSLLRELENAGLHQGEQTISFTGADGMRQTLHVYIDGTDLQMSSTPFTPGSLDLSVDSFVSGD